MFFKALSVFLCIIMVPFSAYAETGKVADLSKGQKAPFTGVLMTNDIATKLYIDSKFSSADCNLKIEEQVKLKELDCKRKISILDSKLQIQAEKYDSIIGFKNNRIDFLEKRWKPRSWYERSDLWFSIGVISGVALTIAAGYALGQASK